MEDIKPKARPQMVILARESRGLSQSALASRMGIAQGTLSKVENGQAEATDELVEKLSDALGYPPAFFFDDYAARNLPISFYRKRISTKIATVRAIRARINILRLHVQKLLLSVDLPECRVPSVNLSEYGSPERVARELRIRWHLPRGPIENLTEILEDAGVVIVRCDFGTNEVAISLWEPADGYRDVCAKPGISDLSYKRAQRCHNYYGRRDEAHAVILDFNRKETSVFFTSSGQHRSRPTTLLLDAELSERDRTQEPRAEFLIAREVTGAAIRLTRKDTPIR